MKKYELATTTKDAAFGRTVYRIRALKDFGDVKAGDLGGLVESEDNLSQEGDCWIYDEARVYEGAWVHGNAKVYDKACIHGNASVSGNAKVYGCAYIHGDAMVFGDAQVYEKAWVYGNAQVFENAQVYGKAHVSGDAEVTGNVHVHGNVEMYERLEIPGSADICSQKDVERFIVYDDPEDEEDESEDLNESFGSKVMDTRVARKFMGKIQDLIREMSKFVSDNDNYNDLVIQRAMKSLHGAYDHLEDIED